MAGIGFELKKMFGKKGIFARIKAYGYAGIVVTGPMLLAVLLLIGVRLIAMYAGAPNQRVELLNSIITVTLLASMAVTSFFSMVTTRHVADLLYEERKNQVLPSFWGSVSIMLVGGGALYAIFLLFSGIPISYRIVSFIFFEELILVWMQMNYLTAIKDYRGILLTFAFCVLAALIAGVLLHFAGLDIVLNLLLVVTIAYGLMAVIYYWLLIRYFPAGTISSMYFLRWFDKYPELAWIGFLSTLGMYGHLVIMWTSPVRRHVEGIFYGAPEYDVPALLAYLSILVTNICFVTSVEVNFYPKYRNYFGLYNSRGTYSDIEQAEKEMVVTLYQELSNTFAKQFFTTIIFIVAGSFLLPFLPLGIDEDMLGIYRVLCVGYALFAIGNCVMLIQLYFADNKGALYSVIAFAATSNVVTLIMKNGAIAGYGLGFIIGGLVYTIVALYLLNRYLNRLCYHVLCNQPIVAYVKRGKLTEISEKYTQKYYERYGEGRVEEDEETVHGTSNAELGTEK